MRLKHKRPEDDSRQRNSLSNIFVSYAASDGTFVGKLDHAFRKHNLNISSNTIHLPQAEIEARIDAADYFFTVLSPEYAKTKECRRQLRYARKRKKLLLPLVHKDVEVTSIPELNLSGPPFAFRETDNFKKSFMALLSAISPELKLDAFISYSHEDSDFAYQLEVALVDSGRKVWLDKKNILYTEEWLIAIHSGILAADSFIFVVSPDSLSSEHCLNELEYAVKHHKKIIPLRLREGGQSNSTLSSIQGIAFFAPGMFKKSFRRLLVALNTDLDYTRQHTKLSVRSREWDVNGRSNGLLLRGEELREARRWLLQSLQRQPQLHTNTQREFVEAGIRGAYVRKLKIAGTFVLLAVIAVVLYSKFSAISRRDEAKHLLAASLALRKETSDITQQSLLLALESYRREPTIEAYQAVAAGLLSLTRVAFLLPHDKPLTGICFTPNGNYVATGSLDNRLRVWNARDGTFLWEQDFLGRVTAVVCSPDGKTLAVGQGNSVGIVDVTDGSLITHVSKVWRDDGNQFFYPKADRILRSVSFSPSGRYLAMLSGGDVMGDAAVQVRVWDLETDKEVGFISPRIGVRNRIFFTPDDQFFVVAPHGGGILAIMETATNRVVSELPVDMSFGDFAMSLDGKYIAAGEPNGAVKIWDFNSRAMVQTINYDGAISCLAFSPNGRYLAIGTTNHYVHVWDLKEKREVSRMKHLMADVELVVFSPDSTCLASAAWSTSETSGAAVLWRIKDGSEVGRLTHERGTYKPTIFPDSNYYRFFHPLVREIVFSPDGRLIATVGPEPVTKVWSPFEARFEFPKPPCQIHSPCREISANGAMAAVKMDKEVWISSLVDENVTADYVKVPEKTAVALVSNDGQIVAITGFIMKDVSDYIVHSEEVLVLFDVRKKQPIIAKGYKSHEFVPLYILSSDGKYLIETRADGTRQIEVASGREMWKDGTSPSTATIDASTLRFDSTGQRYVHWNNRNRTVTLRETATAKEIVTIQNRSQTSIAAVDPKGDLLAIAESEKEISIHRTADGQEIGRITPQGSTRFLSLSPNGNYLAVGTYQNTVHVWRLGELAEVSRLGVDGLSHMTFAPNGSLLIAIRNVVSFVDWKPENLLASACSRLTRNLTTEEWKQYLGFESYRKTCANLP